MGKITMRNNYFKIFIIPFTFLRNITFMKNEVQVLSAIRKITEEVEEERKRAGGTKKEGEKRKNSRRVR